VDVQIHILLTSALSGGEWSASRPGRFTPWERAPGTHWIGGWVDPGAGLDDVRKRLLTYWDSELRLLGRIRSHLTIKVLGCGRAIAQAVSRWLPTAAGRVWARV
jgi:hypothetical protein